MKGNNHSARFGPNSPIQQMQQKMANSPAKKKQSVYQQALSLNSSSKDWPEVNSARHQKLIFHPSTSSLGDSKVESITTQMANNETSSNAGHSFRKHKAITFQNSPQHQTVVQMIKPNKGLASALYLSNPLVKQSLTVKDAAATSSQRRKKVQAITAAADLSSRSKASSQYVQDSSNNIGVVEQQQQYYPEQNMNNVFDNDNMSANHHGSTMQGNSNFMTVANKAAQGYQQHLPSDQQHSFQPTKPSQSSKRQHQKGSLKQKTLPPEQLLLDDTSLSNSLQSQQLMIGSKEAARTVARKDQTFTQVHLKLKTNSNSNQNNQQKGTVASKNNLNTTNNSLASQIVITAANSKQNGCFGSHPPSTMNSQGGTTLPKANIMFAQKLGGSSSSKRLQTLREKVMNYEATIDSQDAARRQANENYHPEKLANNFVVVQGKEDVVSFTDNIISQVDQIPGNTQDNNMNSSPDHEIEGASFIKDDQYIRKKEGSPNSQNHLNNTKKRLLNSAAMYSLKDDEHDEDLQVLDGSNKSANRRLTQTPMLDFRSTQNRHHRASVFDNQDQISSSTKVIQLDRQQFPMMPLLPPSTAFSGAEPGRFTPSVSSDQQRLKLESKLQRIKQSRQRERNSIGMDGSAEGDIESIRKLDESERSVGKDKTDQKTTRKDFEKSQIDQKRMAQSAESCDQKSGPFDHQKQLVNQDNYRQIDQKDSVMSPQIMKQVHALARSDSFIDERCSPREISLNTKSQSANQNYLHPNQNTDKNSSQLARDKLPIIFNELNRDNNEILIGGKKRRDFFSGQQINRKTQQISGKHVRNHSEILQSQQFKQGNGLLIVPKSQIRKNDSVGNVTSSDSEEHKSTVKLQLKHEQNRLSGVSSSINDHDFKEQKSISVNNNKLNETSLIECEIDEDTTGMGQHRLQDQISQHTIRGRSQLAATSSPVTMKRVKYNGHHKGVHLLNNRRPSDISQYQQQQSSSQPGMFGDIFRNLQNHQRQERTPQGRPHLNNYTEQLQSQQYMFSGGMMNNAAHQKNKKDQDDCTNSASKSALIGGETHANRFEQQQMMQMLGPGDSLLDQDGFIHMQNPDLSGEETPGDEQPEDTTTPVEDITQSNNQNKKWPKQLSQSKSIGSSKQLIPTTMAKRIKQSSDSLSAAMRDRSPSNNPGIISRNKAILSMMGDSVDNTNDMLQRITVNNLPGQQQNKDQKQQIKMFSANSRTDHFSDSKVMNRLSLPKENFSDFVTQTEDILESERQALTNHDPHPTFMNKSMHLSSSAHQQIEKQTQSNNDNKEIKYNRTIQDEELDNKSNLGLKLQISDNNCNIGRSFKRIQMSPLSKIPPKLQSCRDINMESIGPQPMESFSESNNQREQADIVDALSNQYLMSSIGGIGEEPTGVCMYEMREFMQEPGASKQISAHASKRYQQLMQQQRRMRGQSPDKRNDTDNEDFLAQLTENEQSPDRFLNQNQDSNNDEPPSNKTKLFMMQSNLKSSQDTSINRIADPNFSVLETGNIKEDFSISENELTGDVRLKIHKKELQYIPREVLQDATIFRLVTVLDISNCRIVELEGRIFMQLKNLTKLHAQRNQIKYLSGRISECQQLTLINLDKNLLEMLPSEIGLLKNSLTVLRLASNKLKQLTLSTRELSKLEILNLADNSLTDLPSGMDQLQALKELQLSGNSLSTFNVLIGRMPKLNKLSLDWFSFLVPQLPLQVIRNSQFDIEKVIQDRTLSSKTQNSNALQQTPQMMQMMFTPPVNTLQASKINNQHAEEQSIYMKKAPPVNYNKKEIDSLSIQTESMMDEDESQLMIASERNHQFRQSQQESVTMNNQNRVATVGQTASMAYPTSVNLKNLNVFLELAVQVELSNDPNKQSAQNTGAKGLDYYTFAESFTKCMSTGPLTSDWMSRQDAKGRTILHFAALKGDMNVLTQQIEKGIDKTKIDQYQFNAYGLALREEHFQAAFVLLTAPSFAYFDVFKGAGTFGSLLHLAVTKLQSDQVRVILEHEVDPNTSDTQTGDRPLHILMNLYKKQSESAYQILKSLHAFGVDFNARNRDNWTPFHVAVKRGNFEAIKAMLEIAGNKPQKSWLAAKTQNPDFVDIDAPGGPKNVTAMHLASEYNFYDIVDLLFQYKANIFSRDDRDNTPYTGITNNLLMIKLLKKEQKAFFNEKYKPVRQQAKELHITNGIFVKQALSTYQIDDPILAAHIDGKYSTLTQTLSSVQAQLKLPLRTHKQAIFQQQDDKDNGMIEIDESENQLYQRPTVTEETIYMEAPAIACSSLIVADDHLSQVDVIDDDQENSGKSCSQLIQIGQRKEEEDDSPEEPCFTIATEDRHYRQSLDKDTSLVIWQSPNHTHEQERQKQKNHTDKGKYEIHDTLEMVQQSKSAAITSKAQGTSSQYQQNDSESQQQNRLINPQNKHNHYKKESSDIDHSLLTSTTVNLSNMVQKEQIESPRFMQQINSAKTSSRQQQNSMGLKPEQSKEYANSSLVRMPHSNNVKTTTFSMVKQPSAKLPSRQQQPLSKVGLKNQGTTESLHSQVSNKQHHQHKKQLQSSSQTMNNAAYKPFTQTSINSPQDSRRAQIQESKNKLNSNISVQATNIESQNVAGQQNINKQEEMTFRLKVERTNKLITSRTKDEDTTQIQELRSVLNHPMSPVHRQASVKAPAQRRLYNNEVYGGVSDSGQIRLTVNASKNLFGSSESQKLSKTQKEPSNSARLMMKDINVQKLKDPKPRHQHLYNHNNQNLKSQSPQSSNNDYSQKATFQQQPLQVQAQESYLARKEHKLRRDQKNVAILSQSLKQHSSKQPRDKQIQSQSLSGRNYQKQIQQPVMIESKGMRHFQNHAQLQDIGGEQQKSLTVQTVTQVDPILQNLISPTAVVDDDLPYSGIEMPAHQPTVKMTKVISSSAYSSQGRINSQNSRHSAYGGSSSKQRIGLDQLLNPVTRQQKQNSSQQKLKYHPPQNISKMPNHSMVGGQGKKQSKIQMLHMSSNNQEIDYSDDYNAVAPGSLRQHIFTQASEKSQELLLTHTKESQSPNFSYNRNNLSSYQARSQSHNKYLNSSKHPIQPQIGQKIQAKDSSKLLYQNPPIMLNQMMVPQKPKLQGGKKLALTEAAIPQFFQKYLPKEPVSSDQSQQKTENWSIPQQQLKIKKGQIRLQNPQSSFMNQQQ